MEHSVMSLAISSSADVYSMAHALRSYPDVVEVAAIAVSDQEWGESVKACVQMRPGCSSTETHLIEFTRSKIASYKKPRSVDFFESLPRLFNGKIDKKALRAPYWKNQQRQVS